MSDDPALIPGAMLGLTSLLAVGALWWWALFGMAPRIQVAIAGTVAILTLLSIAPSPRSWRG